MSTKKVAAVKAKPAPKKRRKRAVVGVDVDQYQRLRALATKRKTGLASIAREYIERGLDQAGMKRAKKLEQPKPQAGKGK